MATPTIQAIETEYAGCRFRSRLEARWAVFFDHMGISWTYEPEGLEFDGVRYLPDFRLHNVDEGVYLEVKGVMDLPGMRKVVGLARHGGRVLVAGDIPRPGTLGPHFSHFGKLIGRVAPGGPAISSVHHDEVTMRQVSILPATTAGDRWVTMPFGWASLPIWDDIDTSLERSAKAVNAIEQMHGWVQSNYLTDEAFAAARSARFEFGECG